METRVVAASEPGAIETALELLRSGQVVGIPTDTVYGIAADGWNAEAVERLFVAKDRPSSKAIMLLLGDEADVDRAARELPPRARMLAARYWPGGLTLVVKARPELPANLRADTDTIGVRLPDAPVVRELVRQLGRPLAATSANRSGGVNPRTVQDVLNDLAGRIPLVLDGGATPGKVASTVLDCTVDPPRVLREGAISVADIEQALGVRLSAAK